MQPSYDLDKAARRIRRWQKDSGLQGKEIARLNAEIDSTQGLDTVPICFGKAFDRECLHSVSRRARERRGSLASTAKAVTFGFPEARG